MNNCTPVVLGDFSTSLRLLGVLPVSLIGIVANTLNIVVFVAHRMRRSPFNWFLLALSFSDLFLLVFGILFMVAPVFIMLAANRWLSLSLIAVYCLRYGYPLALTAQTASINYTMLVCLYRYVAVCHPLRARRIATKRSVKSIIIATAILSLVCNLSRFFEVELQRCIAADSNGKEFKELVSTAWSVQTVYHIIWWTLVKSLVPFFVITTLTTLMVRAMCQSQRLHSRCTFSSGASNGGGRRQPSIYVTKATPSVVTERSESCVLVQRDYASDAHVEHAFTDSRGFLSPSSVATSPNRHRTLSRECSLSLLGPEDGGMKSPRPVRRTQSVASSDGQGPVLTELPRRRSSVPTPALRSVGAAPPRQSHEARVTVMLLVIVAMFLLCNSLPFVNNILYVIMTNHEHMYQLLLAGFQISLEVANLLVVINSTGTIVVYLLFSSNYRQTFAVKFGCQRRSVVDEPLVRFRPVPSAPRHRNQSLSNSCIAEISLSARKRVEWC